MCGEHRSGFNALFFLTGSSPHVRGARKDSPLRRCHSGIIPACAGSTSHPCRLTMRRRDHPRMCGEHPSKASSRLSRRGSSPHVRGALIVPPLLTATAGIIPACAGSTSLVIHCLKEAGDHPRMCGEHDTTPCAVPSKPGSSPHVRGARWPDRHAYCRWGIIPACAGSTYYVEPSSLYAWDHPRMCGEHSLRLSASSSV